MMDAVEIAQRIKQGGRVAIVGGRSVGVSRLIEQVAAELAREEPAAEAREECDRCARAAGADCLRCPWGSGPEGAPVLFVEADEWRDDQ